MKINYRKDLEQAARQMILIHRADTLIKLILRTIVRAVGVRHAGIFVYDKEREEYVARISRGITDFKIPGGLVKLKKDNPLIRYFTDKKLHFPKDTLLWNKVSLLLKSPKIKRDKESRRFLGELRFNLSLYEAKACIPAFFRNELIAVLFLGDKANKKSFVEEELGFLSVLASDTAMAIKNAWLVGDLNKQLENNKRLLLQVVSALASSIEAKDKYTKGHTERVVQYSMDISSNMKNMLKNEEWDEFNRRLKIAALLHDIGKIGIPENILNKPDYLTPEERKIIETHPLIGENILNHIDGFDDVLIGVKHHHERYDGAGYPGALKGKNIPLIAAIIALADSFDAMTTDRPYRKALTVEQAVNEVKKNRGKQFAPKIVDAFLRIKPLNVIQIL
jgi:HD-GYP domain-containing protein (c-di-GMP phosphodiesterase class II)